MMKEYQVFLMDPNAVRSHVGEVLFESDSLPAALTFASDMHHNASVETCVWQPRTQGYRSCHTFDERHVIPDVPHLGKRIQLKGTSQKGKNRVRELGDWWIVLAETKYVLFSPNKPGPWLFVSPEGRDHNDKASRWIHAQHDADFIIV